MQKCTVSYTENLGQCSCIKLKTIYNLKVIQDKRREAWGKCKESKENCKEKF